MSNKKPRDTCFDKINSLNVTGFTRYYNQCKCDFVSIISGSYSFDRLHLAKKCNFKKYGDIYVEKLGPSVKIIQLFNPHDVQTVLRADGKCPIRTPLPITVAALKRDGLRLGMGSL